MDLLNTLALLAPLDLLALAVTGIGWLAIGWWIEHPGPRRPSVTVMMSEYRREWMRQFGARDVRIFDAQMLGTLRQGTSFFASTTLLAIGGVLALVGNPDPLEGVAAGLAGAVPPEAVWQLKLILVALFLTHAFLRFVWSHRIFGYCAVMMGAVPNDPADPRVPVLVARAGELNVRAAWNFNRGLRSMYFALGAVAWLLGAVALIVATCAIFWVLWSREFLSIPHDILVAGERRDPDTDPRPAVAPSGTGAPRP